jgi:hypothetical protein
MTKHLLIRVSIAFVLSGLAPFPIVPFTPVAADALSAENIGSLRGATGITLPSRDGPPCPDATLLLVYDGSNEGGYCWQYGGIVPPDWGSFVESYEYTGCICGIQIGLSGIGYPCGSLTAFIYDDDGGLPGNVLLVTPNLDPCPVATWPSTSMHDFALSEVEVDGRFWLGYWADWSHQPCGYFIAGDTNGFGGYPYTKIAPGIGFPSGWQNVSIVWGPTQNLGIGAWVKHCGVIPVHQRSWGRIKSLYDGAGGR